MNEIAPERKAKTRPANSTNLIDLNYEPRKAYLLAELRCALLRARIAQADIEAVGIALKANMISPDAACILLDEAGCLGFLGRARGHSDDQHRT